jgi:hypothetical protein
MANTKITSNVIADNAVGISALNVSDGSDGQVLTTNGAGTLSFADSAGGVDGIVSSADATAITIDSSENVGIGKTPNRSRKLEVAGNINLDNGGSLEWEDGGVGIAGSGATDVMTFATAGAERMRIDSGGKVGIGTASPTNGNLHVKGGSYNENIIIERTDTSSKFGISGAGSAGFQIWDDNQSDSTRFLIKSSGGAQFYTALRSNAKKMELHNGEGLYVYNNGGGNPVDYGTGAEIRLDGLSHGINATHYLALSGYLPGYTPGQYNCLKTDLNDMHFAAGGSYTGYISGTGGFTDVSDEREKENIETITGATEKVKQLRGVYHTWKDTEHKGTNIQIGLIAQEVEAVVPQVVSTSNPTSLHTPESDTAGLKGVAYAKLVPLLIETIKELEARIESLENA